MIFIIMYIVCLIQPFSLRSLNIQSTDTCTVTDLTQFGKRKQVTKVTFLVKEQNVSVIYTDVNGIS